MGFSWGLEVSVAHVQQVAVLGCPSRFATRCLKLRVDPPATKSTRPPAKRAKRTPPATKLPGEPPEPDAEGIGFVIPFSDTEEEVDAMSEEDRALYDDIKRSMDDQHHDELGGLLNCGGGGELLNKCFQSAVERLLPGNGANFALEAQIRGGADGRVGDGAAEEHAYVVYVPSRVVAGGDIDVPRGVVNVPWGNKLTPLRTLEHDERAPERRLRLLVAHERAMVDASFAVIIEKLGLKAVGAPGHVLVTESSLG